jgi:hypothetical protein
MDENRDSAEPEENPYSSPKLRTSDHVTESQPALHFEPLEATGIPRRSFRLHHPVCLFRAKVPGGWLVLNEGAIGHDLCFVPDPEHRWNGESLP